MGAVGACGVPHGSWQEAAFLAAQKQRLVEATQVREWMCRWLSLTPAPKLLQAHFSTSQYDGGVQSKCVGISLLV